jgi:hypothetical protein
MNESIDRHNDKTGRKNCGNANSKSFYPLLAGGNLMRFFFNGRLFGFGIIRFHGKAYPSASGDKNVGAARSGKLPLTLWFWAAYLMATHSTGISAPQPQRQLRLGSYKSAWLLCAKLRRSMVAHGRSPLAGLVEVDETVRQERSPD